MKVKVAKAEGYVLDWMVNKAEGLNELLAPVPYSRRWDMGGPIIEREKIAMWEDDEGGWFASAHEGRGNDFHGETLLIAAMRCYVASKLGDEVEVPDGVAR